MIRSAYGVPLRDGEAAFDAGQGWLARSAPLPGGLGSEGRSWLERHFPLDFSGESGKTDGAGGRGGMLWIRSFDAACCVVHASQPAYSIRRSVPLWVVVTITHDEMARSGGLAAAVAIALAATGADWSERDGCQTWLRGQDPAGDGSSFTIDHLRMAWWIQGEATANRPIQVSRGESSGSVLDGLAMLIEARRGTSLAPGACLVLSPSREGLGTGLSSDLILGQFADDAQVPSPPPIIARGVRDEQFIDDFPDRRMSTLVDALRRRAKDPGPGPDAWFSPPLRMIDPLLIGDHESVRWIADLQRDPDLIRQRFERLVTPVVEGDARAAIRAAELLGWIADHKGVEAGADLLAHVRKQSRLG